MGVWPRAWNGHGKGVIMMPDTQRVLVASDRIYRLLLRAYPASFRRRYGGDMAQVFRDCCRDTYRHNGALGVIWLWFPTLFELIATALDEHLSKGGHMSSSDFLVRERREGNVGILTTDGFFNSDASEKVTKVCKGLMQEEFRKFVLNLEKSLVINSVGMDGLIKVLERVKELGGKVAFCCVAPAIARTFRTMGMLEVADIYDTEGEAVGALKDPE